MTTETSKEQPAVDVTESQMKMSNIKLWFLYILIGGLIVSALISVVAILVGNFNQIIQHSLITTFILVTHSLLILAIISADRNNRIGKSIIPTAILGAIIANVITTTLGTWGVWDVDLSWRAFSVYILIVGSAYIVAGTLRLRLAHKPTRNLVYTTVGLVGAMTLLFIPWLMLDTTSFADLYYRLVGAFSILTFTSLAILIIVRHIALSNNSALKATKPVAVPTPGGMIAVLISIGTLVAIAWLVGFTAFSIQAVARQYGNSSPSYPSSSYDGQSPYDDNQFYHNY